jgi:nucleoporin SEH1
LPELWFVRIREEKERWKYLQTFEHRRVGVQQSTVPQSVPQHYAATVMTTSQTSLLRTSHSDLITSLSYNLHGNRLATSSLDHTIRVTGLTPETGLWDNSPQAFRAHDTPVIKVVWGHPQFGNILASGSVDGIVKIWLEGSNSSVISTPSTLSAGKSTDPSSNTKKWTLASTISDCTGTIRDLEFALPEFGLKLAVVSSDSHLRLWECLEPAGMSEWSLIEDIDLASLPNGPSSALSNTSNPIPLSSMTPAGSGFDQASSSYGSNQAGSPVKFGSTSLAGHGDSLNHSSNNRVGMVESDGGWSLSWCKEAWWGERLAVSSGTNGIIRVSLLSFLLIALF